jgi:hypothetical protein
MGNGEWSIFRYWPFTIHKKLRHFLLNKASVENRLNFLNS